MIATNDEVVGCGLRVLAGQPMDRELFERLKHIMQSDSAHLRWMVTRVLREDADETRTIEKARLILDAMKTTPDCKDANDCVGLGEPFFFHPWSWAEIALDGEARALGRMKGLPLGELTEPPLPQPGLARDFVVIARAKAGDVTIWPELRGVLLRSTSVWARIAALDLLVQEPTSEDLAVVITAAESDPFQAKPTAFYFRIPGADPTLEDKRDARINPVRFLASQKLHQLSSGSAGQTPQPAP